MTWQASGVSRLRVLRVHHEGGGFSQRARDRALCEAGVDVTVAHPIGWPGADGPVGEVPTHAFAVRRAGDVNRHSYVDQDAMNRLVERVRPDVIDIHEEPVSLAARQWLRAAGDRPVVMYTAQNVDKRWPPPFAQYERAALGRVGGFYPCSSQAASVLRGKGFRGLLRVLPLGVDLALHRAGSQQLPSAEVVLGLVGRLEPEKGVEDAVCVLAALHSSTPARLLVVGEGRAAVGARRLAAELGVADRCTWLPWCPPAALAAHYRRMHVVVVPRRATTRWVEQFGRVVTEGRANGAVPVAYSSGSLPEVVGEAGLTVEDGDANGLSAAVETVVHEPDRWRRLRQRGLNATVDVGCPQVAKHQVEIYERVLGGKTPGASRPGSDRRFSAAAEFGTDRANSGVPSSLRADLTACLGTVPETAGARRRSADWSRVTAGRRWLDTGPGVPDEKAGFRELVEEPRRLEDDRCWFVRVGLSQLCGDRARVRVCAQHPPDHPCRL